MALRSSRRASSESKNGIATEGTENERKKEEEKKEAKRERRRQKHEEIRAAGGGVERIGPARREGERAVAGNWYRKLREFLYGMYAYEFEVHALEMRGELETAFLLITFGDMLGVPVMPPIQSLRILPYLVPQMATWKRRVMRERDLPEGHDFDLHGV